GSSETFPLDSATRSRLFWASRSLSSAGRSPHVSNADCRSWMPWKPSAAMLSIAWRSLPFQVMAAQPNRIRAADSRLGRRTTAPASALMLVARKSRRFIIFVPPLRICPSSICFEDGLDKAQALCFHPRAGDCGDADRAEPISRAGRRPPLPGGVFDLSLDHDAVPRVVAEDERGGEPAARRERQRDAGIGIVALDVLAHGSFVPGTLELCHERFKHGAYYGVEPFPAHPPIRLIA